MRHAPKSSGFTLIELLVVIAIIGILSSVVLASLSAARGKGNDARRKEDLHSLQIAIEQYYLQNAHLPRNASGWCTYISNPTSGYGAGFQSDLVPTFISSIPKDPAYGGQTGDYFYANQNNTGGAFTLCAALDQNTGQSYAAQFGGCVGWTNSYNYCISSQ